MEQLLEQAFASIHRGQFSVAKTYLLEIIKSNDDELIEKKIEAHLALLDIHKHEKKIDEYQKSLITYLNFLIKNKKFEELISQVDDLEKNPSIFTAYFQASIKEKKIAALEELGHFQKRLEEIENYLNLLLEIKQYDLAETYVDQVIKKFPHQTKWQFFLIKILIGKYHLTQAIDKTEAIINTLTVSERSSWCSSLVGLLSDQSDDSRLANDFFETFNCDHFKGKPDFSKLLNTLINRPHFEVILFVTRTFVNSRRFGLAKTFLSYMEKNHKKQIKKHERNYKQLKDMIAGKRTDLEERISLSGEMIKESRMERLKIELSFIKKYESDELYNRCLKKITKLDPFFVDESDIDQDQETTVIKPKTAKSSKQVNPDEIFRNLLSEISYYSTRPPGKENLLNDLERELSKAIEIYQNEILTSNYNDYILMLYSFKLYETALFLVNKVKDKLNTDLENLKAYLEISYMEVILKNEMGKTYDSLEVLNFILTQLPLSRDEKICFLYMAGESYFQLDQGREALKYYRKILKLIDGYRLTKDRMKLLEKV